MARRPKNDRGGKPAAPGKDETATEPDAKPEDAANPKAEPGDGTPPKVEATPKAPRSGAEVPPPEAPVTPKTAGAATASETSTTTDSAKATDTVKAEDATEASDTAKAQDTTRATDTSKTQDASGSAKPSTAAQTPQTPKTPETPATPSLGKDTGSAGRDGPSGKGASGAASPATPARPDAPSREAGAGNAPPKPPAPPPVPVPPPPARRGGAMSAVLGGVVAALIGAAVMYLAHAQGWLGGADDELAARIEALETDLAAATSDLAERGTALEQAQAEIAALKEAEPDLTPVTAAIDEASAAATANAEAIAALSARLDDTDARLQKVAVQQIPEAELPEAISKAYDAKLADLLATIDERFGGLQTAFEERASAMSTALDAKIAEIEASQAEAAEAEAAALEAARLSEARAAMAAVSTAVEEGRPYAEPLAELDAATDLEIPAALSGPAEDGVPSQSDLVETFPQAARAALLVSSSAAADEGRISRFQAFLRTQAGARSLAPREGDDPDAILSRAEAALAKGDLDTALTEIEALPEVGREAMADWTARAATRRDALDAASDLTAQLEQN